MKTALKLLFSALGLFSIWPTAFLSSASLSLMADSIEPIEEEEESEEQSRKIAHDESEDVDYYEDIPFRFDYRSVGKSMTLPGIYSDEIFFSDPSSYHHTLAKSSISLALSASQAFDADEKADGIGTLYYYLDQIGFEDIRIDDYLKDTSLYTVASGIGRKTIEKDGEKADLVVVAIRGANYKNEWVSNLTVSDGLRHEGFDSAATLVTDRVLSYLTTHRFENPTKIWITGFSRGAAIANLVSANLNDSTLLDRTQIYSYCFACPNVAFFEDGSEDCLSNGYENIFNILGASDLIPQFVPADWNFGRYGKNRYLTGAEFDSSFYGKYKKIEKQIESLGGVTHYNSNLNFRMRLLFGILLELAKDESLYTSMLQGPLTKLTADKSLNNILTVLRETFPFWAKEFPQYSNEVDNVFDYIAALLPDLLTQSGFMKDNPVSAGPIEALSHEHFPELYYHFLYSFSTEQLFPENKEFSYILFKDDTRLSLFDQEGDEEVLSYEKGCKTLTDYAKSLSIDLDGFRINDYNVLVLPHDRAYEVKAFANNGNGSEAAVIPYSNIDHSRLDYYEANVDEKGGTILKVEDHEGIYEGQRKEVSASEVAKILGIDRRLLPFRAYNYLFASFPALLIIFLLWGISLIRKITKKSKFSLPRLLALSLIILCGIEAEVGFWIVSDRLFINTIFKSIAAISILTMSLLGKKKEDFLQIHKTLIPFLILALAGYTLINYSFFASLLLFICACAYLTYFNLKEKPLSAPMWIVYGVAAGVLTALSILICRDFSPTGVAFFFLLPLALLSGFSSVFRRGKEEAASFGFLSSFLALFVYRYISMTLFPSVLFVLLFLIGITGILLTYENKGIGEEKESLKAEMDGAK